MTEQELKALLDQAERRGIGQGIRLMQERMLLACENGNPISINGKAYFIKSDMQNLKDIFADIEEDEPILYPLCNEYETLFPRG